MTEKELLKNIDKIRDNESLSHREKEILLHDLERENQEILFIKTDLCPNCGHLTVDVWFKRKRFSMNREKELSKNHRPPKNNLGTLDENIDDKGNINP